MKFNHIWRQVRGAALGFAFLLGGASLAAQGTVTGRVTDAQTKQPLQQAQVTLVGSTRRVLTNADGQYRLVNVPNGGEEIRVAFIGYRSTTQAVTVANGEQTVDFALTAAPVGLEAVTVTATGEAAKRETGNAAAQITMDAIKDAPTTDMADALNSRVPGVVVQESGGTTGTGTRIRIRGSNSISLSNDPVMVVDGVRVESAATSNSVGVGGQVPSRLNDYNSDDLEAVQVAQGPASGVLYGTDAANGVIVMETRKGHPGPTQWHVSTELGLSNDMGKYPANLEAVDATGKFCPTYAAGAGTCTIANVLSYNALVQNSPFRTGNVSNFGLAAEGGDEATTYYVSSHYDYENGVYPVNYNKQVWLRANLHHQTGQNLTLDVSTGYYSGKLRLPQNDNNSLGIVSSGFLGSADTVNGGYGFLLPSQSFSIQTFQLVDHFTGSVQAKYTPYSFLQINAVLGNDFLSRQDQNTVVPGIIPASANLLAGSRNSNAFQIYNWTANVWAAGSFLLAPNVSSITRAGIQYFRSSNHGVIAGVQTLTGGSGSLAGGVTPSVSEATTQQATVGKFVEERVGISNRIFVGGALRSDNNSSFGRSFANVLYPKLDGSWVLSEEPFFPQANWLNSLRLRFAVGRSGLHPQALDALQYYNPTPVVVNNADVTGITVGNLGNVKLKPETDNELEAGFDADFIDSRFHLVATGYSKTSHDALIAVPLPVSCGVCSTTQIQNLGSISNKGLELSLQAEVLRMSNVSGTLTLSAWGNRNRVVTLGQNVAPIVFGLGGNTQRFQPGYAAGAYFSQPYTFKDANGDGLIARSEVTISPTQAFQGQPFPDHGATLRADITVMSRFHFSGLLDGRWGNKLFNSTEQFRCSLAANCAGFNDPKAPLAEQAAAVALLSNVPTGYFQDAGFVKLREIAVTFDAPDAWAHAVRGSNMSITLSGRNLHTWTSYKGVDPELNEAGQSNFTTADFLTQPPVRYWLVRFNITY